MWCGKNTDELNKLRLEYEEIFGYNPDDEMEYVESDYDDYIWKIKE